MVTLTNNSMVMAKQTTIIVRVDEEVKEQLIKLSIKSRRKLSDYIRLLFEDSIKEGKTI